MAWGISVLKVRWLPVPGAEALRSNAVLWRRLNWKRRGGTGVPPLLLGKAAAEWGCQLLPAPAVV